MKKLNLIRNPDVFQGEKYLKKEKNYFEGWYFKNTNKKEAISFIPGISISNKKKKAFIQVITNNDSYYIDYDIKDFQFTQNPFCIKIKNNTFTKEVIHIDIKEKSQNLKIKGTLKMIDSKNIKTSLLNPNIMGPFSYIPFMECNHAILCMQNKIQGYIKINKTKINFNDGIGYIEKDWGYSFPKNYIWCQGNCFKNEKASFMLSIASIPFKVFEFRGFICALIIDKKEYKFTTYNHSKIKEYTVDNSSITITLKRGPYTLNIKSEEKNGLKLIAPVKGKMTKDILESITAEITITLKKKSEIIFQDTSTNCGLEMV